MATVALSPAEPAPAPAPRAGVAAWLSVLLVGLFCLNVAGGWVRVSGAGVAIPDWPVIELDGGRKTLLPPLDDAGWAAAHAAWAAHQEVLAAKVAAGELHSQALGRRPADLAGFRAMFLTEWFHRLLAAAVGLVALACLVTVLVEPGLRRLVGVPVGVAVGLIVVQAVLGAALVDQGTSTHWLFLHQGNAAAVLTCVLIAILRLLAPAAVPAADRTTARAAGTAAVLAWTGLLAGGLLAASRHHLPGGGLSGLAAGPLWIPDAGFVSNLLDNAALHHVLHRIIAIAIAVATVVALVVAYRHAAPERARLALSVAATFVALQGILGIAAAMMPAGEVALPLAHLFLGHSLFLLLVLAWRDARFADDAPPSAERMGT